MGGGLTIEQYIVIYFLLDTKKVGIQVLVNSMQSLSLKFIVLVLAKIEGLAYLHQDSKPLMIYVVKCMRPTIYDWSTSLLNNMNKKIIECKMGRMRNFRFASILSNFFFERVP